MHKITMYEGLRDKIDTEIEAINKKGIENTNIDNLYKLCMSLKCVDKHLECLEEEAVNEENGYSGDMRYLRDGRSYARRRDSMGRYSGGYSGGWNLTKIPDYPYSFDMGMSMGQGGNSQTQGQSNQGQGQGNGNSNGWNQTGNDRTYSYARNRTYSRDNAKMKMVQKLETLMDDTMSEQERMAIRNCINEINMG